MSRTCVRFVLARLIGAATLLCAALAWTASPAHAESVRLQWDPPTDGLAVAYLVERGTVSGTYSVSVQIGAATRTYDAAGLTPGVRYYFVVRSVDASGRRSAASNEISVLVPSTAPPPSSSVTLAVTSESVLQKAVATLQSNSTLELGPGTYALTRPLVIRGGLQNVTLRSSTGRAADVIITGPPPTTTTPTPHAIVASDVTRLSIEGLTIRNTPGYAIVLGSGVQYPRLRSLRIVDNGQFVSSTLHASGAGAVGGLIEGCTFEYAGYGTGMPTGVDIRGGRDWVIRTSRFVDPAPRERVTFGPAIHVWQGSTGTLVERNTFLHTTREIVYGLGNRTPDQHTGGIVRNNVIVRLAATGLRGAAISVLDSPSTVVVHNSALLAGTSAVAIDYAHPNTQGLVIANNLLDAGIVATDGASADLDANVLTAKSTMFVAPTKGDLRLTDAAFAIAVDRGIFTKYATNDHEGQPRPAGPAPDVGADEVP